MGRQTFRVADYKNIDSQETSIDFTGQEKEVLKIHKTAVLMHELDQLIFEME